MPKPMPTAGGRYERGARGALKPVRDEAAPTPVEPPAPEPEQTETPK